MGREKLIATLAIIPNDEKDKKGRMSEKEVKDRSKRFRKNGASIKVIRTDILSQ